MSEDRGVREPHPAGPDQVRLARVALSWLVEPGNLALWRRVARHGPVRVLEGLLDAGLLDASLGELTGDAGGAVETGGPAGAGRGETALRRAAGARLARADPRERAEAALAQGHRLGARVVTPEDDEWPGQLDDLIRICRPGSKDPLDQDAAPPLCLWVRGPWRLDEALDESVAVVGARAATQYGAQLARQIGYGLTERDWAVVSGGAYGIDAYAHRGALTGGGVTVVMLACGVDLAYPASHANLFDRVAEDGLIVSEWPPGAEPFRHRFLIRNRLIAAATRGTLVVEAGARSGALQTLRRAGQLGRCRMVVPGPVTSAMSVGCHEQLRDPEVTLVTGVPHILEEVGRIGADLADPPRGAEHPRDGLAPAEQRLLDALFPRRPLSCEAAAARAAVPVTEAMRVLPSLALRGFALRREHGFVLAPAARPPGPPTDEASA